MFRRIQRNLDQRDRGFTLVELMVVLIIIGVLAAIAIPTFINQRQKALEVSMKNDLANAAMALESYNVDNPNSVERYGNTAAYINGYRASNRNFIGSIGSPAEGFCLFSESRSNMVDGVLWHDSNGFIGKTASRNDFPNTDTCNPDTYTRMTAGGQPVTKPVIWFTVWGTSHGSTRNDL